MKRDNGEMSASCRESNRQLHLRSWLTAHEDLRGRAGRSTGPAWAWLEARHPAGGSLATVNFVWGSTPEPAVRPVAVVPDEVESQFALERFESIGNESQSSRALSLDCSNTPLDDCQAPVLPQSPEAKLNSSMSAPAPESLRDELLAVVRNDVAGSLSRCPEGILEKSANRCRGW